MKPTALQLLQRMLSEGRTTEQIREALNGGPVDLKPAVVTPAAQPVTVEPRPVGAVAAPAAPARPNSRFPQLIQVSDKLIGKVGLPSSGWVIIILACLLPTLLISFDSASRFISPSNTLLALGDITGVVGLVMYVIGLVLATRVDWVENRFGGLNRVLMAHQLLGSSSLILLLMHPFFSAASYYAYGIGVVAHFFVPQLSYLGTAFGIFALAGMIILLAITLFVKLAYATWLRTHKLLGVVYLLIILHVLLTPNHIMSDLWLRSYLYALLLVGLVAYVYRTLLPDVFIKRYLYTIESATPNGSGVIEVAMRAVDKAMHFKAGQFIYISFDNDAISREYHPFSVSSAESSDTLKIDIRSLGTYTKELTRLLPYMVGMRVRVEGAYGRFSFQNFGNVNQVWIAGGIGITPFLSMAQGLGHGLYNIDLYYTVKTQSELVDLKALAAKQSNREGQVFRVFPFVTETVKSHLDVKTIETNTGNLAKHDFLLCGPPAMMKSIRKQLIEAGVSPRQIHSEEFSF